jgi:fructoselysine 6-kinase
MKILAMTVCTVDTYPQHNLELLGGNSLNFATQCKRSGMEHVAMLGAVGTDENSTRVINHLSQLDIDISHLHRVEGKTATNDLYITDTGERYSPDGSWDGGVYQTFRPSTEDWAFAQSYDIVAIPALDPNFEETLTRLKKPNIVVDFLHLRDTESVEQAMHHVGVAFFGGDAELVKKLKPVANRYLNRPVVVTLGAEGSVCLYYGKSYFQEAIPVDNVVDTTGCGDAYQAAFTISWYQNKNVKQAMEAGAMAAAKALTHFGGV